MADILKAARQLRKTKAGRMAPSGPQMLMMNDPIARMLRALYQVQFVVYWAKTKIWGFLRLSPGWVPSIRAQNLAECGEEGGCCKSERDVYFLVQVLPACHTLQFFISLPSTL